METLAPYPSRAVVVWLTAALLGFSVWLGFRALVPPNVVPASAPVREFSAERAFSHLRIIAARPHPSGSPENARVRDYIFEQLRSLKLAPQIQTATGTDLQTIWGPFYWTGTAQNIAVRLEGRQSTGTLLVMAHYDSVPTGPGAADDAAGTAATLEILRGLKSTPPLMNDVVAVFTDGEEAGFVGAQAFLDEHPWAKQVRLALALDFSGIAGRLSCSA